MRERTAVGVVTGLETWRNEHPGPARRPAGSRATERWRVPLRDVNATHDMGDIRDAGGTSDAGDTNGTSVTGKSATSNGVRLRAHAGDGPTLDALSVDALDGWEADELADGPRTIDLRAGASDASVALGINAGKTRMVVLIDRASAREMAANLWRAAKEAGQIG